jgi:hypothetical protein
MDNIEANNCSAPELGLVPGSPVFEINDYVEVYRDGVDMWPCRLRVTGLRHDGSFLVGAGAAPAWPDEMKLIHKGDVLSTAWFRVAELERQLAESKRTVELNESELTDARSTLESLMANNQGDTRHE